MKVLVVSQRHPEHFGKIIPWHGDLKQGEFVEVERISNFESEIEREINRLKVQQDAVEIFKRGL